MGFRVGISIYIFLNSVSYYVCIFMELRAGITIYLFLYFVSYYVCIYMGLRAGNSIYILILFLSSPSNYIALAFLKEFYLI